MARKVKKTKFDPNKKKRDVSGVKKGSNIQRKGAPLPASAQQPRSKAKAKPQAKPPEQNFTPANQSIDTKNFSEAPPEQQFSPAPEEKTTFQKALIGELGGPEAVGGTIPGLALFQPKIGAGGLLNKATTTTEVLKNAQIGKAAKTGGAFVGNIKDAKTTASWFTKIIKNKAAKNTILTAIGSYPFTFFIREEALQIIRGSYTGAMINKNYEEAQQAQDLRLEIVNPDTITKILEKVPFINSINELLRLFNTARASIAIDQKILDDIITQDNTGESDDDKWARVRQEQADQERAAIDYYNDERKKLLQFEKEAKKEQRNEDARFWAKEREKQRKEEEEDRKAIADFWQKYRIESQKLADDSRPSNLNFGLI